MTRPALQRLPWILVWTTAYVAAGIVAAWVIATPGEIALFWPASGVAIAAVMRHGRWSAVLVVVAQLLVHALALPVPLAFLPFSVLATACGALAGGWWAQRDPAQDALRRGFQLRQAALLLAVVSATVGTTGLWFAGMALPAQLADAWLRWAFGDLLGVMSVAPAVLLLLDRRERRRSEVGPGTEAERQAWNVLLVVSYLLMAWGATVAPAYALGLTSLPLAMMVWSALRFSPLRTAVSVLLTVGLIGSLAGLGLAGFRPPSRTLEAVILLVYLCVVAILPMILAMALQEQREAARNLAHRATIDPLTGLPNRSGFDARARERLENPAQSAMALAYLDLDNLKLINDTASHRAGDALIVSVAHALRAHLGPEDLLGHYGADEFMVLFGNCSVTDARARAQGLLRAVENNHCPFEDQRLNTTASIGLIPFQPGEMTLPELMSQADAACFSAKEQGGNRIHLAGSASGALSDATSDMRWTLRIRQALQSDDAFVLHAQSIMPLSGAPGPGRHFELLLRLRDPLGGALHTPDKFLPAAQRFGQGVAIDRKVVETALSWLEAHPQAAANVGMCAINLSGGAMADESFIGYLVQRVRRSVIATERLCFEITETTAVRDMARAQRVVGQLRALGCRFALDDFGTGLCSFSYLRTLDVDFFKIDGSFVRDMERSALALEVVRSITRIAQVLGKSTIAEHTETGEQLDALKALGVDFAQGYLFDRPQPLPVYMAEVMPSPVT